MSKIEIIDVEPQDIEATQETVLDADYLLIDGVTNGTRKIKIENLIKIPNYNWYYNEAKTLVVREKISDGSFRWYFNNFNVTQTGWVNSVPSNLTQFILNNVCAYCLVDDVSSNGNVGFYNNCISLRNYDRTGFKTGRAKTIIESTYTGDRNPYTWEEPTFDPYTG
ncbi:MAG: hypothetical protein IKE85_06155 [Mogibacterium sp.]|nr:hypothetical protein [Mogibacterium sp.]